MNEQPAPDEEAPSAAPRRVMLGMPIMDFKPDIAAVVGMMQVVAAGAGSVIPSFRGGQSNIALCRNEMAHIFLQSDCDTLVLVDSDIGFDLQDFTYLMEGDEQIVIASYAKKVLGMPPVDWGAGFCRIHRSVFEAMNNWRAADGSEALHRFRFQGELATDFFFNGATPDMRWLSEDSGFWHWCSLLDLRMRRETRTRLVHYGRFGFRWPEQIPGYTAPEEGAN